MTKRPAPITNSVRKCREAFPDTPVFGMSVPELVVATGLSKFTLYQEINSGRLRTFKVGRRRLTTPESLRAWIAARERAA